jgi:hypothetical protein
MWDYYSFYKNAIKATNFMLKFQNTITYFNNLCT